MTCSSLISIISVLIVLGSSAGTSYLLIISQIHLGLEFHLFNKSLHTVNCRWTLKFKVSVSWSYTATVFTDQLLIQVKLTLPPEAPCEHLEHGYMALAMLGLPFCCMVTNPCPWAAPGGAGAPSFPSPSFAACSQGKACCISLLWLPEEVTFSLPACMAALGH